jgi:hypothetical protein
MCDNALEEVKSVGRRLIDEDVHEELGVKATKMLKEGGYVLPISAVLDVVASLTEANNSVDRSKVRGKEEELIMTVATETAMAVHYRLLKTVVEKSTKIA